MAGKPAATERFVTSLLERGSLPPDDWKAPAAPFAGIIDTFDLADERMEVDDKAVTEKKTEAALPPTGAPTEPIVVEEEAEPVAGPSNARWVSKAITHHLIKLL